MKTSKVFYAFCILVVAGWFIVQYQAPGYLVAYSFASFSVAWALYRLPTRSSNETLSSFFLYQRQMPKREFIGTLVTTNVGFFSSVAFSCVLIVTMGIGPAVIAVVAWIVGLLWFAYYVPNMLSFFRDGSTLHEYIASSYGSTPQSRRQLRFYSSVITFLLYVASVGAEIKFTADVFSDPTRLTTGGLALLLSIAGVVYVSISGYRGVVSTDRLRFWAILVGVGAIYFFIVHSAWTNGATLSDEFLSARMLSIGPAPLALTSLVVLLALYQFCVMDMWERCIAIAKSHDFTTIASKQAEVGHADAQVDGGQADAGQADAQDDGGQADAVQADASQAAVVAGIRRMIAWSCVPFVFLFAAWYGIGLLALGQHWTDDPNQIVPQLLSRLDRFAASGLLGAATETLIILAFTAAALSTIDGFIIAAVQTVVCDWFPSFTKSKREWNQLDNSTASVWLVWARVLVLLVGVAAVLIAFLSFGVMSFWVGMYSLMLSFFPAVFLRVARPSFSRPHGQVAASILLGASFALAAAILGTFVFPTQGYLTILPPFLAVAVSALVLLPNLGTPGISLKNWMILGLGTLCGVFMWLAPQVAPNRYPRAPNHDSAAFPSGTERAGAAPIAAGDST